MSFESPFLTEEDLKNKIINIWLSDHGCGLKDIHFEYSFKLRIGRSIHKLNNQTSNINSQYLPSDEFNHKFIFPRSDILVRNAYGNNLFIIEVKGVNEVITDNDRDQAISYARILADGNIAPYAIVTNGTETVIFDTITKLPVNGEAISKENSLLSSDFRIACDDILIRAEALELLVSLSPDNLLLLCKSQMTYSMAVLKSDVINSDKKYIPSLYVERKAYENEFERLINKEKKPVVFVVGPPLMGKTNIMCHLAETEAAIRSLSLRLMLLVAKI